SAACSRAEERSLTQCVQAKAWALLVECFDFPRGDCINACQRKAAKASRLVASASRSLVSSTLTLSAKAGSLRLQPWKVLVRQTHRWREQDSNPRSLSGTLPGPAHARL